VLGTRGAHNDRMTRPTYGLVLTTFVVGVGCFVEESGVQRDGPDNLDPLLESTTSDSSGETADSDASWPEVSEGSGSSGDPLCTLDSECADDRPCTLDVCDDGSCRQIPASDVLAEEQTPGDCRVTRCVDGEPESGADSKDVPNDHNDCTVDSCDGGEVVHAPQPIGDVCADGAICDGNGACVECVSPDDCERLPPDDDCQMRTCEGGACGQMFAAHATATNATLQTQGDCQAVVCDGRGGTTSQAVNSDVPVDGLECTHDECTGGVPENPPLPAGTSCAAGECNAVGQCTGCNGPEDCGDSTACQAPTCSVQGVCGVLDSAEGTPVADGQTDGDCQDLRCDGQGAIASFADDGDLPDDDGESCTGDTCSGGLPQHPDLPLGTECGPAGETCDGAGECVACVDADDCPPASECNVAVCTNNVCGVEPTPVDATCDDGLYCTANDGCNGAGACAGTGSPCAGADGDGNCRESCDEATNACTADDPDGGPCEDGLICTESDSCSAGICGGAPVGCNDPETCTEQCEGCCEDED